MEGVRRIMKRRCDRTVAKEVAKVFLFTQDGSRISNAIKIFTYFLSSKYPLVFFRYPKIV